MSDEELEVMSVFDQVMANSQGRDAWKDVAETEAAAKYHDLCGYSCWETDVNVGRICAYCAMAEDLTDENERLLAENVIMRAALIVIRGNTVIGPGLGLGCRTVVNAIRELVDAALASVKETK